MKTIIGLVILSGICYGILKANSKKRKINKNIILELSKRGETIDLNKEISFMEDIMKFFKDLNLSSDTSIPFIALGEKVGLPLNTIFEGVLDKNNNSITNYRIIKGTGFDPQTNDIISKAIDGIVVLK